MNKGFEEDLQFALLRVGAERYAVDIMRVKEILRPLKVTPVKRSPEFVEGVIDLRGEVIPVVDLRRRLGGERGADTRRERIVVVDLSGHKTGLLVDEASEVFRLPPRSIQPPPPTAVGADPLFSGIAPHAGELIMVLDLDHLFTMQERRELSEARDGEA